MTTRAESTARNFAILKGSAENWVRCLASQQAEYHFDGFDIEPTIENVEVFAKHVVDQLLGVGLDEACYRVADMMANDELPLDDDE